MVNNFRPLMVSLLLVGLLIVAVININLLIAVNDNPQQTIGNDKSIQKYAAALNTSLEDSYVESRTSEDAISGSPITLTTGSIIFDAIGGIWKTIIKVPITIYNLTVTLIQDNLIGSQNGYIILGVFSAIILISIVLSVWKMVSSGDGG